MKKVWPAVLYLLILCSCGKETDRAEAMQEQYKNLASYETDVHVSVPRGDETLVYTLHLSTLGDAVRTVSLLDKLHGPAGQSFTLHSVWRLYSIALRIQ